MKITYHLTPEDITHAQLWLTHRKHPARLPLTILNGLILLVMSILFFKIGLLFWKQSVGGALFDYAVAAAMLGYSVYSFAYFTRWNLRRLILKRSRKEQGLIGNYQMVLSPEWLIVATESKETKASWTTVDEFGQDSGYLYLVVDSNMAQILPRRAFATPDEADRFLSAAQGYWNAARNGTPLPETTAHDDKTWPPAPRTL